MTTILPPIPKFVFMVFEPVSLIAGSLAALLDPPSFTAQQIPPSPLSTSPPVSKPPIPLPPTSHLVTLQLSNAYLLLCLIGLFVLYSTTESKVVRRYLIALALGDVGHLAVTYSVLGRERYLDWRGWNAMAWGNVGVTTFLFLTRLAYLLGLLGPDQKA
ncbi:MAG: hypothetical protein M1817_001435 [Caeruleum heppii]|nr:MAG: hypothetical protein M1817_001435 [Caeruleum heppii]